MVRGKPNNRLVDMVGKEFSRLTVLKRSEGDVGSKHPRWDCVCECGGQVSVRGESLKVGKTTSCGCAQRETQVTGTERGIDSPNWKSGRNYTTQGYVRLRGVYDHPNADSKGRISEHIKVMSDFLGRPLDTKNESVHHKNGLRDDNRIDNLELRARHHGFGHTIPEAIKHAVDTLCKYAPDLLSYNVVLSGYRKEI